MSISQVRKSSPEAKVKNLYLDKDGLYCPYCGNGDIVSMGITADGITATEPCVCNDCEGEWTDVFTLIDIDLDEEHLKKVIKKERKDYNE